MTSSTSPAGPSGPAAEGFRILGPVSGRVTGEAPVVRARPGAPTGRVVGAPSKPAVVVEGRSGNSARRDQPAAPDDRPAVSPDRPAVPHDEPAWGAPVANRPAAGRRGIHDHDGAGDTARRPGNRGHGEAGGQGLPEELLVFDSHEPPRRTPLPAGANAATPAAAGANAATPAPGGANAAAPAPTRAKVAAPSRRAHPRPPRRGGRAAVLAGAAAIAVAGVSVGAFEVAGGSGLPSTPAAAKGPLVRHSPTVPSTTATTAPAPTTTVPPFTLVSNTNGTASYAVSGSPTVVVSAQGPCWVEAHQPNAQGNVVYAAILAPGQTETLHAPVWIRLGAPSAVTVTVNGTSLPPLVTGGAPWNLDLQ